MRYRFYREHKYINYMLFELERFIAKADFNSKSQRDALREELITLEKLFEEHTDYEEKSLHSLLKARGSSAYENIEIDHISHEKEFKNLIQELDTIDACTDEDERINFGHHFYLSYRIFVSDTLKHLNEEEIVVMAELQRLYSDVELKQVEAKTYNIMTVDEIVHMAEVLFPHMNSHDREAFLIDIKESEPEKFAKAWERIAPDLPLEEFENLERKLG